MRFSTIPIGHPADIATWVERSGLNARRLLIAASLRLAPRLALLEKLRGVFGYARRRLAQ